MMRPGISALLTLALLMVLSLPSCGNGQTAADSDETTPPTGGGAAPAAADAAPVAKEASSPQWPKPVGDEDSALSTGIVGKVIDRMPPSLVLQDVMIQPGETAEVSIKLGRGVGSTTINTYPGRRVIVTDGQGAEVLSAKTDQDGRVRFRRKFAEAGNYFYRATVEGQVEEKDVRPSFFGVYVRDKDVPIVICDMDKTLVKSGFGYVLAGLASPFDGAKEVLHSLVADRGMTVVYLTHRPDFLDSESRAWLRRYDFPPGPLVGSTLSGLLSGSEKFKTGAIAELKKRYAKLKLAIGDKIADANAYVANQVPSILLPDIEWDKTKAKYWREKLTEIQTVDPGVTVCRDWSEISQATLKDVKYPLGRMVEMIREAARKYEDR